MACEIEDETRYAKMIPTKNPKLATGDFKEENLKKDTPIISDNDGKGNGFVRNNWLHQNAHENKTLLQLKKTGAALWISSDGNFYYRRSQNDTIKKLEPTKMKTVLCATLNRENINVFNSTKDESIDIKRNELLMCEDRFAPFENSEFYLSGDMWYRTSFYPSIYLKITAKPKQYREPERILWLIKHLCNGNSEYFRWVLNWIACFFKTLEKSQVSLVLKGEQGTGKGILFERIFAPLFGEDFCVVVDDDRLGSNFKNWIDNTLFFNLNEIAHDMRGRKSVKNFIKMLVTDRSMQVEKKYENATRAEIFGNVLITSNENYPLEVEPSDRRFTVISTGKSLKKIGINTSELIRDIELELESFAYYLKNYACDISLYHTALDTPEKRALIDGTTDRFTLFARAITEMDLDYFSELEDGKDKLYERLKNDFEKGRIRQSDIKSIYNYLFDENIPSKTLFAKLRAADPLVFPQDRKLMQKSNGEWYYMLNNR